MKCVSEHLLERVERSYRSLSLTRLFGHGGRLDGAEEDGIGDLHP